MPEVSLELYYEPILKIALLDPLAADYHKQLLSILKTDFTINLAAHACWSKDGRLASFSSFGFPAGFIRSAHNVYINDEMHKLTLEQLSSNSWNGIFYSQDTDPFTYASSNVFSLLNQNNISYFALIVLSKEPWENIVICKTDREGPFTKAEKDILGKLSQVLSRQAETRRVCNQNRQVLEIIKDHCTGKETGLIISDRDHNILTYNKAALSLMPRRLNLPLISEIAAYVFSLFENEEKNYADWDAKEKTVSQNGRIFTLEEIEQNDEEGIQDVYYLITITRSARHDNKVDLKKAAQYGLTGRERNIAQLIVAGYSNAEIAEQLHITIHTVKIHVSNLFRKLNVHTRLEAIMKLSEKA